MSRGNESLRLSLLARPESHPGHVWSPLWTPPRRQRLNFRIGEHRDFVDSVFDHLGRSQIYRHREGIATFRPDDLHFTGAPTSSWLNGLVHAWAEVADILTFYQERWIQEGFLRTANDPTSVFELARMIGYSPRPATAGEAWLAFFVAQGDELPHQIDLSERLRVQAVPADGRPPQSFELTTGVAIERPFNHVAMPPAGALGRETDLEYVDLPLTARSLKVRNVSVAPGEGMAVVGERIDGGEISPFSAFVIISDSKAVPGHAGLIELSWQDPLFPDAARDAPDDETDDSEGDHLDEDRTILRVRSAHILRQTTRLFGAAAPLWSDTPLEVQRRQRPLQGGVALRAEDGSFQPSNGTLDTESFLPMVPIAALHWMEGVLLAAGPEGVYRSSDRGATWVKAIEGLAQSNVLCLAPDGDSAILAGTNGGIYRSTDGGRVWDRANGRIGSTGGPLAVLGRSTSTSMDSRTVRSLVSLRRDGRIDYLAGTDEGIFHSGDMGSTWKPACRGLPNLDSKTGTADILVFSLIAGDRSGQVLAGTSAGVYESSDRGRSWQPCNLGLPETHPISEASKTAAFAILAVVVRRLGVHRWFAGTEIGLFVFDTTAGSGWIARPFDPDARDQVPIRHLAIGQNRKNETTLFAGSDDGLWSSRDYGETWTLEPMADATHQSVSALGAGGADVAVATPFDGFDRDEWPGFHLRPGQIDLESQVSGVVAGGFLALDPNRPGTHDTRVIEIEGIQNLERRDFSLTGRITRVYVDRSIDLSTFDLRETMVWLRSEPLPLARDPMLGWSERLGRFTDALREWGERPVLGTVESPLWQILLFSETLEGVIEATSDEALHEALEDLIIEVGRLRREQPFADPLPAIAFANRLEATHRRIRHVHARLLDSTPRSGSNDSSETLVQAIADSSFGEPLVRLLATAHGAEPTGTTIDKISMALDALLGRDGEAEDGAGIRFEAYGNLGRTGEGTTTVEVLGSGDADALFQRFTLSRPLAWDETDTGLRASLMVEVDAQPWRRVDNLYDHHGDERVYAVRRDVSGRDQVLFGDGENGALLPNGRENVRALYRTEITSRAVANRSLTMIQSRPLGLARTFNPYTGTPGATAEPVADIRREAPYGTRSFERVVSRSDYEDFVRSQAGVTRARAFVVDTAVAHVLQISVAFDHTLDPYHDQDECDAELRALADAIARRRDTDAPFDVQEVESVPVQIDAIVRYEPSLVADDATLRRLTDTLHDALSTKFGFDQRELATPLAASEVIRVLQDHRMVRMVQLCAFEPTDPQHPVPPTDAGDDVVDRSVPAARGRNDGGLKPAQVTWLDLDASRLRIVSMHATDVRCDPPTDGADEAAEQDAATQVAEGSGELPESTAPSDGGATA
ncbi:MAG: hypothetical protein AAGE94_01760 [Acidobacteriota bacterium]